MTGDPRPAHDASLPSLRLAAPAIVGASLELEVLGPPDEVALVEIGARRCDAQAFVDARDEQRADLVATIVRAVVLDASGAGRLVLSPVEADTEFDWGIGHIQLDTLNYQWNPGDDATPCFDLAELPVLDTSNKVKELRSIVNRVGENHLDVGVQDDTTVDYVTVKVVRCKNP